MEAIKCNYKPLIKWIKSNPKVRTFTEFAHAMGYSVQRIHYKIINEAFMSKEVIARAKETFNFTDEQVEVFFYSTKSAR